MAEAQVIAESPTASRSEMTSAGPLDGAPGESRRERLARRYRTLVTPRSDGLPTARVLLAFPALLLIAGVLLIGLGINGSSSGAFYSEIGAGQDPDLLAGQPQNIRSDEWNVGTSWLISQVEQGLPARNEVYPGGMDAELPYDLPHTQPSIVLKPHLWGFLFLDVDHAVAWKWWIPGLSLIAAAYLLAVTILPRRPIASAGLAVAFFYSPFFQWWYQTSTLWPIVWGLATIAALAWATKTRSVWGRWLVAIPVAYVTIVMATGIYAPFIIPVVLTVLFFGIGLAVQSLRGGMRWRELGARVLPILVAGVVASGVTLAWVASKAETVNAFLGTVYPGERLTPTGSGSLISLARMFGSSFSESLRVGGFLGINSSEASSFFLVGVVLLPVLVWIVLRRRRASAVVPWAALGLAFVVLLFLAFMLIPGWDTIAHALFLDRSTGDRLRIGFGLASFTLLVLILGALDSDDDRPSRLFAGITAGAFLATQLAIAGAMVLVMGMQRLWDDAPLWWLYALVSSAAIYAFARRRVTVGAALFLIVAVASAATVNPVYRGVLDLRETDAAQAVMDIDDQGSEAWVGIGGIFVGAILLESGVEAYNGTQGAPSRPMWHNVDPDGEYEPMWNRIGAVLWEPGIGEPVVSNPAADVILSTFDACSDFAQDNVGHVLTDRNDLDSPCLVEVEAHRMAKSTLTVYDVVPG